MAPSVNCPTCCAALQLTHHDTFDSWICPTRHGRAASLSELDERAQEDESRRLWALAKESWVAAEPVTGRACPMCSRLMVTIVVPTDRFQPDAPGSSTGVWTYHLQSAGGIVADSDPDAEYQETVNKAAALARAIDAAESAFA